MHQKADIGGHATVERSRSLHDDRAKSLVSCEASSVTTETYDEIMELGIGENPYLTLSSRSAVSYLVLRTFA
jgi:hypothetical protein